MTHDELVQFAAEKVGISVHPHEGMYGGFYARVEGFVTESRICKTEIEALKDFIDLTSPDLFFKGLEVCPHFVVVRKDEPVYGYNIVIIPEHGSLYKQSYTNIDEIPQKFWECWAEVEGGK